MGVFDRKKKSAANKEAEEVPAADKTKQMNDPTSDPVVRTVPDANSNGAVPPSYSESADAPTPSGTHPTLADAVTADVRALAVGDPNETISVPMIHSTETINWRKYLSKDRSVVTHTVIVRKMPRDYYLKHYAKDDEGNYVGTEKPAVDAGLVFVPSKSTPEDLLQQVHKVAFGKEHYAMDFSAGQTMIPFVMNTGGGM